MEFNLYAACGLFTSFVMAGINSVIVYRKYTSSKNAMIKWLCVGNIIGAVSFLLVALTYLLPILNVEPNSLIILGDLCTYTTFTILNFVIIERTHIMETSDKVRKTLHVANLFFTATVCVAQLVSVWWPMFPFVNITFMAMSAFRLITNYSINMLVNRTVYVHYKKVNAILSVPIALHHSVHAPVKEIQQEGLSTCVVDVAMDETTGPREERERALKMERLAHLKKLSMSLNIILSISFVLEIGSAALFFLREQLPGILSIVWSLNVGIHLILETVFQYKLTAVLKHHRFEAAVAKSNQT